MVEFVADDEKNQQADKVCLLSFPCDNERSGEKPPYSRGLPQFFISDIMEEDVVGVRTGKKNESCCFMMISVVGMRENIWGRYATM